MHKVILITGASRGIGFETARLLAIQGHSVIVTARTEHKLINLRNEYPQNIIAIPADLTSQLAVQQLVNKVGQKIKTLDVLINNAGLLINKPFEQLTDQDWKQMLDVNLMAGVALCRELLPLFSEPAHIVNISSMGGFQGSAKFPGLTGYSVAKGALSILTECLSEEWSDRKIAVNALCLGAVQTEMLQKAFPGIEAPVTAEQMGSYIARFAVEGAQFYNGKILPTSLNNPE